MRLYLFLFCISFLSINQHLHAQISNANRSGFTWISNEDIDDDSFGAGYSMYAAAWPIFKQYPGPQGFQMGLCSSWLTTQRTGEEPNDFYTTIEGGLGWWHDTRFGTKYPKFIMGGVSYNFYAWANGPGAGRSDMLPNGQRDWSTPGGKYDVAQLSNRLVWAPDGLNMSQCLNGEMLGYGYLPLPLSEPMDQTSGQDITTGNQYWTLFVNSNNFKGPITTFLPTFWTKPVLENPSLEGFFLDTRPSDPNVPFGIEHAVSPALIAENGSGDTYAKIARLHFPVSDEDNSMLLHQVQVYSKDALWNNMESWFDGGTVPSTSNIAAIGKDVNFINNGGAMVAEIKGGGLDHDIELAYINNVQQTSNVTGFEYNLNTVEEKDGQFVLPEYFKLESDGNWHAVNENDMPSSNVLLNNEVPLSPPSQIPYLTPFEPDCQWQDPNGPWHNPGPVAGPFYTDVGDGSRLTYYWYRFVDQPAVIHANLPADVRNDLQERVELIHSNWSHTDDYYADPGIGSLASLDPAVIVQPPSGLEVGYVPIVTRQEKSPDKVRVFVLAGQSNMEGYGLISDPEGDPGSLEYVIENDQEGEWSVLGEPGNWNNFNDAYLYFSRAGGTIKTNVSVGQGAYSDFIGPELMFAQQLDEYYEEPILIIKTAWGGKSLAVDFRPPSASGDTGEYYTEMINIIEELSQTYETEFPSLAGYEFDLTGFAWFQGWNDGASDDFLNEYESNLHYLVNDIRSDLQQPHLPVVIANSGHGGFENTGDLWVSNMQSILAPAQENVACNDSIYGGLVGFIDTKQFYFNAAESPSNSIHHFNDNALTYLNIGRSMGMEMKKAINDMAFCYTDCDQQVLPELTSIGNRVWNDLNMNGINDPDEPGIPGVSLVIWSDSDGDGIPDWQGFGGVRLTDEEGYYRFSGLAPGNYVVFVWSVDNWDPGQPLHEFQSTGGFVEDADNDIDFDNNGFGGAFTDIMSGIVTLGLGEEPLGDGDPFSCYFDYDACGNNTVDFGFFNPNVTQLNPTSESGSDALIFPNPTDGSFLIKGNDRVNSIQLFDVDGEYIRGFEKENKPFTADISDLAKGVYVLMLFNEDDQLIGMEKVVKQ